MKSYCRTYLDFDPCKKSFLRFTLAFRGCGESASVLYKPNGDIFITIVGHGFIQCSIPIRMKVTFTSISFSINRATAEDYTYGTLTINTVLTA
jgi:hypothetical protein